MNENKKGLCPRNLTGTKKSRGLNTFCKEASYLLVNLSYFRADIFGDVTLFYVTDLIETKHILKK